MPKNTTTPRFVDTFLTLNSTEVCCGIRRTAGVKEFTSDVECVDRDVRARGPRDAQVHRVFRYSRPLISLEWLRLEGS
jgi:hypothetical protein